MKENNKKPYGFIDGPFIPQDTQSKKSKYIVLENVVVIFGFY